MSRKPATRAKPKVSLVLGGGGARGFAHIVVLEALDDLGIRPVSIAGTSIGAILGAAYAAGCDGKTLRRHALSIFRDRSDVMARLFAARVGKVSDLWSGGLGNPLLIDGEVMLDRFLPRPLPELFEDLSIPLRIVATDYYGRSRAVFSSGQLRPAVAASSALPWLVRPVRLNERVLVDGGAVDPLPIREADADADIILAIDVSGDMVVRDETRLPAPLEAMLGMSLILQSALTEARLASKPANARVLRAAVQEFGVLDFFRARQVFAAAEALRDQVKEAVSA